MQIEAALWAERSEGIERAAAHANDSRPGWSDMAVAFIHRYAKRHASFIGQDVIVEVKDARAWGRPFQLAQDLRYIARGPYTTAGTTNRAAKPIWISRVFSSAYAP